jgi:hypothetical protein
MPDRFCPFKIQVKPPQTPGIDPQFLLSMKPISQETVDYFPRNGNKKLNLGAPCGTYSSRAPVYSFPGQTEGTPVDNHLL